MYDYNPLYDLLRSDGSIVVNKHLIFAIGLNEAIIYSELVSRFIYFAGKGELSQDGYFYNTIQDLYTGTGLREKAQRLAIKNLKKLNLIDYKTKGLPPKRYFFISDDFTLIGKLLMTGREKQAQTLATSKFRRLDGINSSQVEEFNPPFGRTNNTNYNTNKIILNNNDNGRKSNDVPTYRSSQLSKHVIKYYLSQYESELGYEHPTLKSSQLKRISQQIDTSSEEWHIDESGFEQMIDAHFQRKIETDYNINHFATDGILTNLMYSVLY